MSSTRQLGRSGSLLCRNSRVDPKSITRRPTEPKRLLSASRSDSSSSMTKTTDCASAFWFIACLRAPDREHQLKYHSMGMGAQRRKGAAMRLDDRTADREAQAHAIGLGRVERLENAVHVLRVHP